MSENSHFTPAARPTVFIPSIPHRWDAIHHHYVAAVNVEPAATFGEIVLCISPIEENERQESIDAVRAVIDGHYSDGDYIMSVGDPIYFAAAVERAAKHATKPLRILRWNKTARKYHVREVSL